MRDIQCARELSDEELENVSGGARHFPISVANASAGASASATGGFFHISEGFAVTDAFTVVNSKGAAISLAFGVAFAVAL